MTWAGQMQLLCLVDGCAYACLYCQHEIHSKNTAALTLLVLRSCLLTPHEGHARALMGKHTALQTGAQQAQ